MITCVRHTQEKVYYKLAFDFLTSDYFASCAEMSIIGNIIHPLLILSCETVITLRLRIIDDDDELEFNDASTLLGH